jgi:hypothetical protein
MLAKLPSGRHERASLVSWIRSGHGWSAPPKAAFASGQFAVGDSLHLQRLSTLFWLSIHGRDSALTKVQVNNKDRNFGEAGKTIIAYTLHRAAGREPAARNSAYRDE